MKKVIKRYSNFINESEVKKGQSLPEDEFFEDEESLESEEEKEPTEETEDDQEELVELVREFNTLLKRYIKINHNRYGRK